MYCHDIPSYMFAQEIDDPNTDQTDDEIKWSETV